MKEEPTVFPRLGDYVRITSKDGTWVERIVVGREKKGPREYSLYFADGTSITSQNGSWGYWRKATLHLVEIQIIEKSHPT